jgi:hypothetical protein
VIYSRWVGQIARVGETRHAYRILVGKPLGKCHLGDQERDEKVTLRWILGK